MIDELDAGVAVNALMAVFRPRTIAFNIPGVMAEGRFRLAVQEGERGFFGSVTLQLQRSESQTGLSVDMDPSIVEWRAGVHFGVAYAYEQYLAANPKLSGLAVRVVEAEGHLVDSTEVVMAYVAAQAFWDAAQERPRREPAFDAHSGLFTLPK